MNPTENNPHWDEKVNEMLDKVMKNNLVESTDTFKSVLASKISQKLLETKRGIYSERYDKNLDANKNGKIDVEKLKALTKQNLSWRLGYGSSSLRSPRNAPMSIRPLLTICFM